MTRALSLVSGLLVLLVIQDGVAQVSQETPGEFLARFDSEALQVHNKMVEAYWASDTNITDENSDAAVNESLAVAKFSQKMQKQALAYLNARSLVLTADQKRQLTKIADIGTSAETDEKKLERLKKIVSEMTSIYSKAEVCLDSAECLKLEPGLTELLRNSRDCDRLSEAWQGWREQSGKKVKELFPEYVKLSNDAVRKLGHKDMAAYWKSVYDTYTFEEDIATLLDQILPLYQQLHGYVRRKLKTIYGPNVFPASGHIPAHLLGNMWAQSWSNVGDLLKPYKNKHLVDVTDEMKKQGYTAKRMFETAEGFFYSLGFDNMTETFWRESMLVRPEGRDVVCHASAWDFYKAGDFRIKMCTTVNHEDLVTIHHEMGHIQYYMEYNIQSTVYREGANPGFHEAVGDTIALSAGTPNHLKAIGLLNAGDEQDAEADINFLMQMALEKIAFLPFGYLIDQWRWSVFRGDTPPQKYNEDWWNLRCRLQGISPPVQRKSSDFDPGAKYHVVANVPYIRYFVSFVIQFQFYKAACDAAGYTGPLYKCDFYNNKAAGEKLISMLKLGSSKPWPEAMEKITGQRHMDAGPLVEYFQPLLECLKRENGEDYGWDEQCPDNPPPCSDGGHRMEIRFLMVSLSAVIGAVVGLLR